MSSASFHFSRPESKSIKNYAVSTPQHPMLNQDIAFLYRTA